MIIAYILQQLKKAQYKLLKDRSYFGEIPGIDGVWANAKTLEECRKELQEVLEEWLVLKIREESRIPGLRIKVREKVSARYA